MAENTINGSEQLSPERTNEILRLRREKLDNMVGAGHNPFEITKFDVTHHSSDVKENFDALDGKEVTIAGRLMSKRVMGKASFCHVQDLKGQIQSYVSRDSLGDEAYADFKKLDIGDIIGVLGKVFKTQMGEISIHADKITLLTKSLQILPEKYHGLTNVDQRYRQRYVDLIMNPESKDTFIKRSKIISSIRKFLDAKGFMEVETPMLVSNAGGAAARPFETHFNALDTDFRLRISLELYLKRLIVGGLERVYEIGRVFRNEGLDTRHNPEFTLMELYQAYTDYHGMMDLTEEMYRHVAKEVLGSTKIVYNGVEMDLGKPFERITMIDAVKKYTGVDFNEIKTLDEARAVAKEKGVAYEERHHQFAGYEQEKACRQRPLLRRAGHSFIACGRVCGLYDFHAYCLLGNACKDAALDDGCTGELQSVLRNRGAAPYCIRCTQGKRLRRSRHFRRRNILQSV